MKRSLELDVFAETDSPMTEPEHPSERTVVDAPEAMVGRGLDDSAGQLTVPLDPRFIGQRPSVDTNSALSDPSEITIAPIRSGLHDAEAARASTIGAVFSIIGIAAFFWAPFLKGHPGLRIVYMGGLVAFAATSLVVWRRAAIPEQYTRALFRMYGGVSVFMAIAAMAFLAPFRRLPWRLPWASAFWSRC